MKPTLPCQPNTDTDIITIPTSKTNNSDRSQISQIPKLPQLNAKNKGPSTIKLSNPSTSSNHNTCNNTNLNWILCNNRFLPGSVFESFIILLRQKYNSQPVHIASTSAIDTIDSPNPDITWNQFSGLFGRSTRHTRTRKPDGLYLIPLFTGHHSAGHWSLAIIEKIQHRCNGWIADSLGTSNISQLRLNNISQHFYSIRTNFHWNNCHSTPQTEVECGPRTMLVLHSLVHNYTSTSVSVSNLINTATTPNQPNIYNSTHIRNAATLTYWTLYGHTTTFSPPSRSHQRSTKSRKRKSTI